MPRLNTKRQHSPNDKGILDHVIFPERVGCPKPSTNNPNSKQSNGVKSNVEMKWSLCVAFLVINKLIKRSMKLKRIAGHDSWKNQE